MVRRSSRLQAGNYYTVRDGRDSTPVAAISYYETPARYVNLHFCIQNANIGVFLFPAGVTEGPASRKVRRRPLLKVSMSVEVMWGLCGAMRSSSSRARLLPQVSNQSPAPPRQDAGAESLSSSLLLNVSVDSSQSNSLTDLGFSL